MTITGLTREAARMPLEAPRIAYALDVEHDRVGCAVGDQELEDLAEVEVERRCRLK
ncbi:MAG: hypothetical protein R2724_33690 [Bryobacterales bacterium]